MKRMLLDTCTKWSIVVHTTFEHGSTITFNFNRIPFLSENAHLSLSFSQFMQGNLGDNYFSSILFISIPVADSCYQGKTVSIFPVVSHVWFGFVFFYSWNNKHTAKRNTTRCRRFDECSGLFIQPTTNDLTEDQTQRWWNEIGLITLKVHFWDPSVRLLIVERCFGERRGIDNKQQLHS